MNTDELRMVLDAIKEIAGTAGTVGIVWVVIHYLVLLCQAVVVPVATAWVFYRVFVAGFDAWKAPKYVTKVMSLDGIAISEQVCEDLKKAIFRVRSTAYIHASGVKTLNDALDMYEASGKKLS